jgi:acetophenone carboxylase
MENRLIITEYLEIDLDEEMWYCIQCNTKLNSARENYKKACNIYNRDPTEIHQPLVDEEYNFAPDPKWMRIVEFACPNCAIQIDTEYLPPGHPVTHDIELDIDSLKAKLESGEYKIENKRLVGVQL